MAEVETVCIKAQLLLSCVVDMHAAEGEEAVLSMANQNIHLVEDPTEAGRWLVRGQRDDGGCLYLPFNASVP